MSFQLLNDFTGLEIPDEDRAILTTAHNPLAACDRKAAKDAVRVVLVSCVGLETSSCVIIPKAYCVIQCRGKNVLAVR